jgi:pimeloyl-ACP methyl ester carboxylesterase
VTEVDVPTSDGRKLHAYDTGGAGLVVMWHHGTPNIGTPPAPLFTPGVRWIAYDRPNYGGSTALPGRRIGSAAADAAVVADALGVDRFAVLGHSGGGPHALACAALLPERVTAAVSISGMAPFDAPGLDWFAGMGPMSEKTLRAAAASRAARAAIEGGEPDFLPADWAALEGAWGWFGSVVAPAVAGGPAAAIDDDMCYVTPWGFDPADVRAPTLVLHGEGDLVIPATHGAWLAGRLPSAELRVVPGAGHISVMAAAGDAVNWLLRRAS